MDQTSRAGDGHDDLRPNLLRMLLAARSEAVIQTPCVSLTPLALEVLSRMGRNGVRIPMLTNGIETDENAVIQAFFLRFWPEYLARIPGLTFDVLTGTRMLHSKVAVLDRVLTLIGSYNLDPVSEVFNGEVGIAVWSPEFAAGNLALDASDRHPGPDPRNPLVRRYDVVRDSAGLARRHPEGHPRAGEVEVAFGPEHHTAKATLARIVKAGSRIFELFLPRLARFSR